MRPDEYGPREPTVVEGEHVHRPDGLVHIVYLAALGGLVWHAACDLDWMSAKRTTSPDSAGDEAATCLRCIICWEVYQCRRRRYR